MAKKAFNRNTTKTKVIKNPDRNAHLQARDANLGRTEAVVNAIKQAAEEKRARKKAQNLKLVQAGGILACGS